METPAALEVNTDESVVRQVRSAWLARNREALRELLIRPAEIVDHDARTLWLLREQREMVVTELRRLWLPGTPPAASRMHALRVLNRLGESLAPELLVSTACESREAGLLGFEFLDQFVPVGEPLPELIHDFVLRALESPEAEIRAAAFREVNLRRLRAAAPVLERLWGEHRGEPELREAAAWLRHDDEATLRALCEALTPKPSREERSGLAPLLELARGTTRPEFRDTVAESVSRFLLALEEVYPGTESLGALDWLAGIPERERAADLLERVAQEAVVWRLRAAALSRLRRIDAARGDALLQRNGWTIPEDYVDDSVEPVEPIPAGTPGWRLLDAWATEFARRGLFSAEEMKRARRVAPERGHTMGTPTDASLAAELLADAVERTYALNYEDHNAPLRHDWFLQDLAMCSAGQFRPQAITEEPTADSTQRFVQFIHGSRLYRFAARSERGELDEVATLTAVHRALADGGVAERFLSTRHPDADGIYLLFVEPAKLSELGTEYESDRIAEWVGSVGTAPETA